MYSCLKYASLATISDVFQEFLVIHKLNNTVSYSTVVLYIGIMKVRGFWPKLSPQNQLDIYFLTLWEYWLGLAKPKNVFRSILNPSIK